ncbi:MAG: hypothetical protein ABG776_15235 [Cyanobacteria bacterium J06555_13]
MKIAQQTIDSILLLLFVNVGSAVWLAFFSWHTVDFHFLLNVFIVLIIGLPSFILAKVYLTLQEIIGLPEKVTDFFDTTKTKLSELNQAQARMTASVKEKRFKVADLISVGKSLQYLLALGKRLRDWVFLAKRLREIKALMNEFEGLAALTAGAMLLANPIFLGVTTLAVIVTSGWALLASITVLVYVF